MSLNLGSFHTVFDDNFSKDTGLNKNLWTDSWGNPSQYSFSNGMLTLTGYQHPWWQPVGLMQKSLGNSAGEGYGLYQFSGYGNAGQGVGICFIMWRADNTYLDASTPGKATEIDILESWDKTKTGQSTLHYYDTGWKNNNGQAFHPIYVDLTKLHTYAMDWERGSLTFYVDGKQVYQDTQHAPLDAADGGSNEVMGAQVINEAELVTTPTVALHITDMSYSVLNSASPPPASRGIVLARLGTVHEPSVGAGAAISETLTSTGLTGNVYAEVLTSSGAVESPYQMVGLGFQGAASFNVHLAKSGDSIKVVDNIAKPSITVISNAVSITDQVVVVPLVGSLPSPLYTGTEMVTGTGGIKGLRLEAISQGSYNAPGQTGWVAATVGTDGRWSAPLPFTTGGAVTHVYAQNGGTGAVVDLVDGTANGKVLPAKSAISISAPGTQQEPSVGAGVTLTETLTTTGLTGNVYAEVLTASGAVETAYKAVALAAGGTTTLSVHLAKSGDTIKVVDNIAKPAVTAVSSAVTITDRPVVVPLAGSLPNPLYTGAETVTGTGGVKGLRLEPISKGTYNAPGQSGWVTATVGTDGKWSASVPFATGSVVTHVYAQNGGTGAVVDLVDGTATSKPLPGKAAISISAPGTRQEPSVGAGVTFTETLTTSNLTGNVYAEVLTASGTVESAYKTVALATGGTTTLSVHLAKTGDVIKVVNSTASPTVTATSSPITITEPSTAHPVLAGVLPSPLYTGVETVTGTGGVSGLQLERITQGTYNAPGQTGWVKATVASNGNWSAKLTFTKPGQVAHVYAANGGTKTVVDLLHGTPIAPPTTASGKTASMTSLAAGLHNSVALDMAAGAASPLPHASVMHPGTLSSGSVMTLADTQPIASMVSQQLHLHQV